MCESIRIVGLTRCLVAEVGELVFRWDSYCPTAQALNQFKYASGLGFRKQQYPTLQAWILVEKSKINMGGIASASLQSPPLNCQGEMAHIEILAISHGFWIERPGGRRRRRK